MAMGGEEGRGTAAVGGAVDVKWGGCYESAYAGIGGGGLWELTGAATGGAWASCAHGAAAMALGNMGTAAAAVNIALHDLAGRAWGVPAHVLLGGRRRAQVLVYSGGDLFVDGRSSVPQPGRLPAAV